MISSVFLVGFFPDRISAQYNSVRIQVIDRGQGDGILIRTPNQKWIVIDAGSDSLQVHAMRYTWEVDTVILAVITHRHRDHLGGMDDILGNIPVRQLLWEMDDRPNFTLDDKIREIIQEKQIPVLSPEADTLIIDSVSFVIFPLPPDSIQNEDENNHSIVIKMEYGDFSMLFTGDAEKDYLEWLVHEFGVSLDADILKASHHGSRNGTTECWLQRVTPERVVISAGISPVYKHPHEEAVNAYLSATGNRIYCTNRHGTIRIYGYADGRMRISKQFQSNRSCVYSGD